MSETKTYFLLIIALILFWLMGSFVDTALWFHNSYNTPSWVITNLDIFWLALSQTLLPFLIVIILKPKLNTILAFAIAMFLGSVIWDLNYSLLTRGTLISDSMNFWFSLKELNFKIGITENYAWLFHGIRIICGIILSYILIKRLNKKEL